MMTKCPTCGSTEIIPDLVAFTGSTNANHIFVILEPAKGQKGDEVSVGFRADVCGSCGHTEFYTKYANDLLEAHKKGYVGRTR